MMEVLSDYNISRPFDRWKWSEAPEVNKVVSHLIDEIRILTGGKRRADTGPQYAKALKKVILDLHVAHLQNPRLFVAYSRDKNEYVTARRFRQLCVSYVDMITVVDALAALDYIHHKVGFFDRSRKVGKRSRMRAEPKLIDLMSVASIKVDMIGSRPDEIILKDGAKRMIDYRETGQVARWREHLKSINSHLSESNMELPLSCEERRSLLARDALREWTEEESYVPDPTRRSFYRIFNNASFTQGGRLYGHWIQNLPKDFRKSLKIDGEPATELDYSGLHINMLYCLAGHVPPDKDVYAVNGIDPGLRPLLKKILLIMLNADSDGKAIKAIWSDPACRRFGLSFQETKEIMREFAGAHAPIQGAFNSGAALKLQHIDSQLAERVMLRAARDGVVCLGIHDSFISPASYRDELRRSMDRAFEARFGVCIPIDEK